MQQTMNLLAITIFLCGDVMTGRGIDQVLPHPSPPRIYEPYVTDAREYVRLAERTSGPLSKPFGFSAVWGDALSELARERPDVRIINLETAITTSNDYWAGKGINYRMNPANAEALSAAEIDVAELANNHVLDWGYGGLAETIRTLEQRRIRHPGAGWNKSEAEAPAVIELNGKGRVIVMSFGRETSGIPAAWAATDSRPGVNLLPDLSADTVKRIRKQVLQVKKPGDIVIASIHWGANWGYDISDEEKRFAHGLIDDAGVDVVHGHSSHHLKAIEVYQGKLVLYGCGDFLDDYEGIGGYEQYRGDLGLMYFAKLDPATGRLLSLLMTPTQIRQFSVTRAKPADAAWIAGILNREGKQFGTGVEMTEGNRLRLTWRE